MLAVALVISLVAQLLVLTTISHLMIDGHRTISRGNNTRKFAGKQKGAESGFVVVLDPAKKDIWLLNSSALNQSLRGDIVVVESWDSFEKREGKVVANISTDEYIHPKEYFVCFSARN